MELEIIINFEPLLGLVVFSTVQVTLTFLNEFGPTLWVHLHYSKHNIITLKALTVTIEDSCC